MLCMGFSFFLPDSLVNVVKKYYPLVLSNECKYIVIKEKNNECNCWGINYKWFWWSW